jgi:hypothetical protein
MIENSDLQLNGNIQGVTGSKHLGLRLITLSLPEKMGHRFAFEHSLVVNEFQLD